MCCTQVNCVTPLCRPKFDSNTTFKGGINSHHKQFPEVAHAWAISVPKFKEACSVARVLTCFKTSHICANFALMTANSTDVRTDDMQLIQPDWTEPNRSCNQCEHRLNWLSLMYMTVCHTTTNLMSPSPWSVYHGNIIGNSDFTMPWETQIIEMLMLHTQS